VLRDRSHLAKLRLLRVSGVAGKRQAEKRVNSNTHELLWRADIVESGGPGKLRACWPALGLTHVRLF